MTMLTNLYTYDISACSSTLVSSELQETEKDYTLNLSDDCCGGSSSVCDKDFYMSYSYCYSYGCASDCNEDCDLFVNGQCALTCEEEQKAVLSEGCAYASVSFVPTQQPTNKPTDSPTLKPTDSPTSKPTTKPEGVSYVMLEVQMTADVIPSSDQVDNLKNVFIAELNVDASKIEDVWKSQ